MPPAQTLAGPWTSGAADSVAGPVTDAPDKPRSDACTYLPDLCAPMAVLGVVLIAELMAIALTLARQNHWVSFFSDLGRTSFVLQWLSLTSAAVLCGVRPLGSEAVAAAGHGARVLRHLGQRPGRLRGALLGGLLRRAGRRRGRLAAGRSLVLRRPQPRPRQHHYGRPAPLLLCIGAVAAQRAPRGRGPHSRVAGAHPAPLPVQ